MLHLRLTVPPELTGGVTRLLEADPRVTHLAVLPGAARQPAGDLLLCDVAREAASDVLAALRDAGVDGDGSSVTISQLDAALSDTARRAEESAPGSPDDGIVWDLVLSRAEQDARPSWTFYTFLCLATLIAAVAVLLDSPVLVVGAMVVGPEFGPVAAVAVGLVLRRPRLTLAALRLLAGGFALAIAVTVLATLVVVLLGWVGAEDVTGDKPMTRFIWTPDRWSFVVALLAGAAGVLSITAGRTQALVGVFISVTTVPAAGLLGAALATGTWGEVGGGAAQLGVNLVGMTIAGVLVLLVQRAFTRIRLAREQ